MCIYYNSFKLQFYRVLFFWIWSRSQAEEEEEEAEDDEDEIESHKKQLEELKSTQPEFYEFLQKEGGELLDFGDSDEDMDEDDEEEAEEGAARGFVITKDTFDKWVQIAIKLVSIKYFYNFIGC